MGCYLLVLFGIYSLSIFRWVKYSILVKQSNDLKEVIMEGLAAAGFVFGVLGLVAFVRLEKLIKTLKEKGILEDNYKEE